MNTYRVIYISGNKIRSLNIDIYNGYNIINEVKTKIKSLETPPYDIKIINIYVISCQGCKFDAPGQLDHMGIGGCLS